MNHSQRLTHRTLALASILASLFLATLACQVDVGGPEPPFPPITANDQAANEVTNLWQSALESALDSGEVMLILDESQLNAFVAKRLAAEDSLLQEPQVFLRQNAIQVYGYVIQGIFRANIHLSISPILDQEGRITFELTLASVGPIPVPEAVKNTISAILTEAFTGTLGSLATGIRVSSLVINDGQLAIVGELR
ncbi:MAG: hypothetical protein KAS80_00750 [Anaerolineales bacterium]|nr:hypothetical protein [Anaerolineales bacterium]TEU00975.1 MAG: hypothetical protein E3J30_01635 [Anaerolineales bacterium]